MQLTMVAQRGEGCRFRALSRGKTVIGQFHGPQIVWPALCSGQLHRSRIALSLHCEKCVANYVLQSNLVGISAVRSSDSR